MTNPFPRPCGDSFPSVPAPRILHAVRPRHRPPLNDATLKDLSLYQLRQAIRVNTVTFPSPVPTFERHDRPDLQWRIAQLYFVSGWSSDGIAKRFGILRQRACQILNTWKRRAVEMGYIQCIPPAETIEMAGSRDPGRDFNCSGTHVPTTARSITVTCDNVFEDQRPLVNPGRAVKRICCKSSKC